MINLSKKPSNLCCCIIILCLVSAFFGAYLLREDYVVVSVKKSLFKIERKEAPRVDSGSLVVDPFTFIAKVTRDAIPIENETLEIGDCIPGHILKVKKGTGEECEVYTTNKREYIEGQIITEEELKTLKKEAESKVFIVAGSEKLNENK